MQVLQTQWGLGLEAILGPPEMFESWGEMVLTPKYKKKKKIANQKLMHIELHVYEAEHYFIFIDVIFNIIKVLSENNL